MEAVSLSFRDRLALAVERASSDCRKSRDVSFSLRVRRSRFKASVQYDVYADRNGLSRRFISLRRQADGGLFVAQGESNQYVAAPCDKTLRELVGEGYNAN